MKRVKQYLNGIFGKRIPVSNGAEFEAAMRIINHYAEYSETVDDKLMFLKYALSVVRTDLISSYRALFLYKEHIHSETYLFPNFRGSVIDKRDVDIKTTDIFVIPWKISRIIDSLKFFRDNLFQNQSGHVSLFYPILDICHIQNGTHSVSACKYYRKGVLKAGVYDIEKAFALFTTDGDVWISNDKSFVPSQNVLDYRAALIFEIGRMICQLL